MSNKRKYLTPHVSWYEATKSYTAEKYNIDNTPNEWEEANMKKVAGLVFEPLREFFNCPIGVTSFFRSNLLNKKIGGAKYSQHRTGQAMDIDADVYGRITNRDIFEYIMENLDFDQLIWEFGSKANPAWVHVSYVSPEKNRKQVLKAFRGYNNRTRYKHF